MKTRFFAFSFLVLAISSCQPRMTHEEFVVSKFTETKLPFDTAFYIENVYVQTFHSYSEDCWEIVTISDGVRNDYRYDSDFWLCGEKTLKKGRILKNPQLTEIDSNAFVYTINYELPNGKASDFSIAFDANGYVFDFYVDCLD